MDKLRGMFAFVIWDKVEKVFFGARDHLGKKDYSRKIWTALTFMVWHRIYIEESQEFLTEPLRFAVSQ